MVVPHPPQFANWGTFPQGKALYAKQEFMHTNNCAILDTTKKWTQCVHQIP